MGASIRTSYGSPLLSWMLPRCHHVPGVAADLAAVRAFHPWACVAQDALGGVIHLRAKLRLAGFRVDAPPRAHGECLWQAQLFDPAAEVLLRRVAVVTVKDNEAGLAPVQWPRWRPGIAPTML
jgi:hypothetical protein